MAPAGSGRGSGEGGRKLAEYERRRSFARTPEPGGEQGGGAADGADGPEAGLPRFVIQEHSATRLHWDLRLEHDGVLASWALPRGLPTDPEQNRMAAHTEDHPLSYLDFEGEIPKGNYGAGTMRIVDRGRYEIESWSETKVVFELHGERQRGRYALFSTERERDRLPGGGKNWLIHRMDPPDPDREPLPEDLEPMRASPAPGDRPPDEDGWAFEIEWRGARVLAALSGGRLELWGPAGSGEGGAAPFPELRDLARQVGIRDALLDGVVVSLDADGQPDAERLKRRLTAGSESAVRRLAEREPATLILFDLLHLDGSSLLALPLRERREVLEAMELEGPAWRTPAVHVGEGEAFLHAAAAQGVAGAIAKRLDSPYEPGADSGAWLRLPTGI
jgi:bifunctional non-homologous end joining protein LigD